MSKRAVIIGATSGMGYEIALILASKGWQVGAAGRRQNLLEELKSHYPQNIVTQTIDSQEPDSPQQLQALIEKLGGMDLFLNSAGIGSQNHHLHIDTETSIENTNVIGFTRMVCAAYKYFRDRKDSCREAHVVAITSIAGTKGLGASPAYSATKRFQSIYLECLEQQSHLQKVKIHFTDIRPGFVTTALLNDNQHYPMQMEVKYAARKIVKAIESKKRVAIIDWKYAILVFFWRLIPRWLWVRMPVKTKPF